MVSCLQGGGILRGVGCEPIELQIAVVRGRAYETPLSGGAGKQVAGGVELSLHMQSTLGCRHPAALGGGDITVGAVELTDVLGEVPAIGVPGAVKLDSQRAGGDRLTRLHPIAGSPLAGQTCFAVCPIPLRALGGFGWNPTGAGSSPGGGCE